MCMVYMCDTLCVWVFNLVVKVIRKYQQKTHEGRDVHADVRLVFLDGFKGTDRVPVEAVPREGRRVFARTLERDAEGEYRVEALDEPQGVERDDLGAFVIAMLESLVREREPRTADVFVSSASRICLDGAVDALVELDARGWRIFCWDLLEAEAADPHDAIRRLLRRDGSTRLDDPWVAAVLRDIALANRMWRHANAFVFPIRR